jgi:group II intron reverse transcriptase/maturase
MLWGDAEALLGLRLGLEFDIKGLFDNIDHTLLLRAVRKHVTCPWAVLTIERWLTAPMSMEDGTQVERTCGTPQGGVVSPVLANLFLHYAFDLWMARTHPELPWCRYADDGLVHCRSEQEAQVIMAELQLRLAECRLEMHPTKTKIVYCKDGRRKGRYANQAFDFLGYSFRPRLVKNSRRAACSGASPRGQPSGAHEHAADDPEDQLSQSDPEHAGGRRPSTQSGPQGLDGVLRSL